MSKDRNPRPRTKPPEERRGELMDAAERLFLDRGVASTTIEQITAKADVAKGTFYLYFSSKENVLAALADRFAADLLGRIRKAIAGVPQQDWKGKLAAWASACVNAYLDSIELHDLVFYGSRPAGRENFESNIVVKNLVELLQAGAAAGAFRIDDPRLAAVFLFSGLHGVIDDSQTKGKRLSRVRLAQRLRQLCFRVAGLEAG